MKVRRLDSPIPGAMAERPDPALAPTTKIDLEADGPSWAEVQTAAPPPRQDVSAAQTFTAGADGPGHYRTRHLIHRGHWTTIALAGHAHRAHAWFAVKRIHLSYASDSSLHNRFEQEAVLAGRLCHPHLSRLVERGKDREGPWLAMDYIPGPADHTEPGWPAGLPAPPLTLARRIDVGGPLTAEQAVDLGLKLCSVLEYLHDCRILHGDVRPDNVLYCSRQQPVLIDYGLSRPLDESETNWPSKRQASIYFAAPELGSNANCRDRRVDVYGLGSTLVYSLTNRYPQHCAPGSLPEAVRATLQQAIEADPGRRFATIAAFGAALGQCLAPVRRETPTPTPAAPVSTGLKIKRRLPSERPNETDAPAAPVIRRIRRLDNP